MREWTFAQGFALLALNAQDSLHMTTAKKIAVRCMAAAAILEWELDRGNFTGPIFHHFRRRCGKPRRGSASTGGITGLLKRKEGLQTALPERLKQVIHFPIEY